MAIYRTGTCSMTAGGVITGVGTKWKTPLSLIRVGATIVFLQNPIRMATISAIVSDTELRAIETDGAAVPSGNYILMLHDSITVDGLAQDVSETLRYYQSQETQLSDALEFLQSIDYDALKVQLQAAIDAAAAAAASAAAANTSKNAAAASATSATASATSATASKNAAKTSEDNAAASAAAASTTLASAYKDLTLTSTTNLDTLNSYDKFGIYRNEANANATVANNYPEQKAGTLLVTKSAYGCQQMYITFDTNCIYTRGIASSSLDWRPWRMAGFSTSSTYYTGDMNALSTVGRWAVTTAATNLPMVQNGICTVETRTTEIIQTYRTVSSVQSNADRVFYRTGNSAGTTWTKWSEVITDSKSLPSDITNIYPTSFISALTSDVAAAHKPVLDEAFGGLSVARDLRPAQFGVSGAGASASFWYRGYANATSTASEWKKLLSTTDVGDAAYKNTGTAAGTVAAGNDARLNTVGGKTGGTISSGVNVSGNFSATGNITSSANVTAGPGGFYTQGNTSKMIQGTYVGWNELGISGGGSFTCNRGQGDGGFAFRVVNSGNTAVITDFQMLSNGTGTSSGGWIAASDERVKEDVSEIDPDHALDAVCSWRSVTWNYASKPSEYDEDGNVTQVVKGAFGCGYIAQDVMKTCPDAVTESSEPSLFITKDGELFSVEKQLNLNTLGVSAGYHGAAIKALNSKILKLTEMMESMQNEINKLKGE